MDQGSPFHPRVSRETRRLLITAVLALAALWMLARARFPDQTAAQNPVQPFLTQLAPRARLDDLAAEVGQLLPRIQPLFADEGLRISADTAISLRDASGPKTTNRANEDVLGFDALSGLAVVRASPGPFVSQAAWMPAYPGEPRYLIAADLSTGPLALRPLFVGALTAVESPVWGGDIWALPDLVEARPGSFAFTGDALLAGLIVHHGDQLAIVPGPVLRAHADRLLVPAVHPPGYLGLDVQAMTASIARATGAAAGVVVTWVDPEGPARQIVAPGDVIETADGQPLVTPLHWKALTARLPAGGEITLRVRRAGSGHDAVLTAAPAPARPSTPLLGLTLRGVPGIGAGIVRVERGSVAERAGLTAGDVITFVGGTHAPSPVAVRRALRASHDSAVLVAFTRDGNHHVTALEP